MTVCYKLKLLSSCLKGLAVAACLAVTPSQAAILFNYPDFSDTTGLTFAGSAGTAVTSDGTVLRLTPSAINQSGAAHSTAAVTLGPNATFSTRFQFRFTGQGGIDPADGITFVLAAAPTGLGGFGGGLGYQGVPDSVAIEFDTFFNSSIDASSNHVAIDTGGALTGANSTNLYSQAFCDFASSTTHLRPGCMSNGDLWNVEIGYDGTNLSLSAWDQSGAFAQSAPFTVYNSVPLDIVSAIGSNTAFVALTSGTGGGIENHDILNWQFSNTTELGPTAAPEPATLVLMFGGLAGFALVKRRRRS